MPIPTQTEMFRITLEAMLDGKQRSIKEIKALIKTNLHLEKDELKQKTSSGIPVCDSRVGWAITYLNRAGLFNRVSRGVYVVTSKGLEEYSNATGDSEFFGRLQVLIAENNPWHKGSRSENEVVEKTTPKSTSEDSEVKSPEELIDGLVDSINGSLKDELMKLIMECDSNFFEKLIVDLLEAMGYGKGEVTSPTNDGGIDGLITTDELGFRPIYTQAKCYSEGNKIGRPDIQSFAGALNDVQNGVFITTSSFTDGAYDYAKNYPKATIVLIDGDRLTDLMIKYGLGVTKSKEIVIKRIDSDYFED